MHTVTSKRGSLFVDIILPKVHLILLALPFLMPGIVKMNILGVPGVYYYLAAGFCMLPFYLKSNKMCLPMNIRRMLVGYLVVAVFFCCLSYTDYINGFYLSETNFRLDRSFIPRQAYFIFFAPYIYCIIKESVKTQKILSFIHKYYLIISVVPVFMLLINYYNFSAVKIFLPGLLLHLFLYKSKILAVAFGYTAYYILANVPYGQGSTDIIFFILSLYMLFNFNVSSLIAKHKWLTVVLVSIASIIVFNIFFSDLLKTFQQDGNTIWRFEFWRYQFNLLKDTYYVGVGFGTPYASDTFFLKFQEFQIAEQYESIGLEGMKYIVAQHSSFVNMFYRLGVIGGSLFVGLHWVILNQFYNIKIKYGKSIYKKVRWLELSFICAIVNIALNVGIESPLYFIPYLFVLSLSIGMIAYLDNTYGNQIIEGQPHE